MKILDQIGKAPEGPQAAGLRPLWNQVRYQEFFGSWSGPRHFK